MIWTVSVVLRDVSESTFLHVAPDMGRFYKDYVHFPMCQKGALFWHQKHTNVCKYSIAASSSKVDTTVDFTERVKVYELKSKTVKL